jgi:hypothetical protein
MTGCCVCDGQEEFVSERKGPLLGIAAFERV